MQPEIYDLRESKLSPDSKPAEIKMTAKPKNQTESFSSDSVGERSPVGEVIQYDHIKQQADAKTGSAEGVAMTSPVSSAARTTSTSQVALASALPPTNTRLEKDILTDLEKLSKAAQKSSASLVRLRFQMAGVGAEYIRGYGADLKGIKTYLEERGQAWPENNCKLPLETALVREFIFKGEDCISLKNRVSEFARVVRHLVVAEVFGADAAVSYIKQHNGLRGLYAKLDVDGNWRDSGTDKSDAQQPVSVEQSPQPPKPFNAPKGAAACATNKVQQVVSGMSLVVAESTQTMDFDDVTEQAEAAFRRIEAEVEQADRDLKAAHKEAETAAEEAEASLADRIAEAERIARAKAAEAQAAERLLWLANRLQTVPIWGEGKFDCALPPSKMGGEWAYGGVSLAVIRTDDDGSFYVVGNVTPPWNEFKAIIETQFPS